MTRSLIFFNGTDVMLIPEKAVPFPFVRPTSACKSDTGQCNTMTDGNCGCVRNENIYKHDLSAAKSKAIRVENSIHEITRFCLPGGNILDTMSVEDVNKLWMTGTLYELPEGYKYEVRNWINECPPGGGLEPHQFDKPEYAIISPVQPTESKDELWDQVYRIMESDQSNGTKVAYLKSKFTITRKQ